MILLRLRPLYVLLFACTLLGCAGSAGRYLPVSAGTPRISTLGFSVLPPPGPGWYEKISKDSLFYFKKIESETYAIATKATELQFKHPFPDDESFSVFTTSRKEINGSPALVQSVGLIVEPSDHPGRCLRYRQVYEDYRTENGRGPLPGQAATVTNTGLICVHPDNERVGIDLYYQERRLPGGPHLSYAPEGEAFLNNLSFLTLEARR